LTTPTRRQQFGQQSGRRRLAAEHQRPGRQQPGHAAFRAQRRQVGGHHLDVVDLVFGQVAGHRAGIRNGIRVDDVQRAARRQTREDHRVAEVGHRGLQQSVPGAGTAEACPVYHPGHVVHQAAVRDLHALGNAGRS
jgi:hypothetical protein